VNLDLAIAHPFAAEQRGARVTTARGRFDDVLRRHHAMLRRVAAGVLADVDALDDVMQDAYLKAFRALPASFANEAHEAAWLYQVVYRTCLDELRRRRRRPRQVEAAYELPAPPSDPGEPLAVRQALRLLTPDDRAALLLVDLAGLDYETAAAILVVPRGTLASRLNVARSRFRKALDG
jgi:RNA polymerase sigma-70 factor (ECF subfamily)